MNTKNKLIESAIELLNDNASCNLDLIAEKAGVTRRTLHRYFKSREHMIEICAEAIVSKILVDVQEVLKTNSSPIDQLRQMFEDDVQKGQHFEFCQKFADQFKGKDVETSFKEMGLLFYSLLDELKSLGLIDLQLSNDWLSYVWMGMIRSATQALKDGIIAPKKATQLAWNAFSNGVMKENSKSNN